MTIDIDEHDLYTVVSCLIGRPRKLEDGCYDEGQQNHLVNVIKKLGGVPPSLAEWITSCGVKIPERIQ